ncbi:MAG: hypothetical protein IJF18_00205 [Oscillospiraceae bacterium]|nr:hypothetical protein [Oscillospiraceae bacterium]
MTKKKKQKASKKTPLTKANIQELQESRDGGQIALRGYSYQFLYSCNLILSSSTDTVFTLEGIEDIDTIKYCDGNRTITHIQLKYSSQRQDASFMDSVLKNYLEAYLIDKNRHFKLVYDFSVAAGNLSKLFSGNLDKNSKEFWKTKVDNIKKGTSLWNWNNFDFEDFIQRISFENIKKDSLEKSIEDSLIENFEINTDNISLFANGIKLLCFDKMESRSEISHQEITQRIEEIKFDISKGPQNPAHAWIQRLRFSKSDKYSSDYYEGKKATPSDIANNLPVIRPTVEKEIIDSISKNAITIIKTSSGQGKTTLALRAISLLTEEYTPYQITRCNNDAELGHIVEYFRMRTRIGEKPLILLDNLDAHLSEWNLLAQLMQTSVTYHYKLLVTSRENDWYNYGGDISNLHRLNIIKPTLSEKEAESIYNALKKAEKLHEDIVDWKKAWSQIAERQLLIEYVYLLTHGEMIAERISAQMKEIGNASAGGTKFEILRKVCFADVCGIKLETKSLIRDLSVNPDSDIGEVLKSLADEFLVHISSEGDYIEGLHPVRSQHIVNRLHEYITLDETALAIAKIASVSDISILFSHYPEFDFDKKRFYANVVSMWFYEPDLSRFVHAIRGAFSGSVMQYYRTHKALFDDAYEHGGLVLVATDLCPFSKFEDCEKELNTLNKMAEIMPDNTNIQHMITLRDSIPKFKTSKTDIFCLSSALYSKLKEINFADIADLKSYAVIVDWLYNIDPSMNLSSRISLNDLWVKAEDYSVKTVSSLMYSSFCGNKDGYNEFVRNNLQRIISYLKRKTNSHKVQVSDDNKKIKVEYLLRASEITKGNNESVARLTDICRTLPIFETYCSDAIKPQIDLLATYQIPNDAHKEMPKENIIITFHQEFNGLWLRTIESNYEFDTVYAWIDHWLDVRKCACDLLAASSTCLHKLLGNRKLGDAGNLFDALHNRYNKMMVAHLSYPREHRPFEKKPEIPTLFNKAKRDYFDGIHNFANQLISFIKKEEQAKRLAIYNLKAALAALPNVQKFFDDITLDGEHQSKHVELCALEEKVIFETYMCCEYYLSHAPETNYNKYQVKAWFSSSKKTEIDEINSTMTDLSSIYDAVLPKSSYRDNTFLCYPILFKNFDPANDEMMNAFLITSISFAKSPYDYLLLLLTNNAGEVIPNAIKFPKKAFKYIHNAINLGVEEEMDPLASPYPIEVTEKMLECFDGEYILQKQEPTSIWLGRIADIGEELWMYSKNREYLVDEEDKQYLFNNLNEIKNRIDGMVKDIEPNVSVDILTAVNELCNAVYQGDLFDDKKYNELISCVQTASA